MIRRPPGSTRTDTLFPYTTLFRSAHANSVGLGADSVTVRGAQAGYLAPGLGAVLQSSAGEVSIGAVGAERQLTNVAAGSAATDAVNVAQLQGAMDEVSADGAFRSDERRVGEEWVGSCSVRRSPYH